MEFLKDNFDIQSNVELNDTSEQLTDNVHSQRVEKIMAQINAKLEKLSLEERKKYLSNLREKIDSTIIKKEKSLFEYDSTMSMEQENMFDFDISMLEPIEDKEEIIDVDVSSLKPIDDIETQHKR